MRRFNVLLAVLAAAVVLVLLAGGIGYRDEVTYRERDPTSLEQPLSVHLQSTGGSTVFLGLFGLWRYGSPFHPSVHLTLPAGSDATSAVLDELVVRAGGSEVLRVGDLPLEVAEVMIYQGTTETPARAISYFHSPPLALDAAVVTVEGRLTVTGPRGAVTHPFERRFDRQRVRQLFRGV